MRLGMRIGMRLVISVRRRKSKNKSKRGVSPGTSDVSFIYRPPPSGLVSKFFHQKISFTAAESKFYAAVMQGQFRAVYD